MRSHREDRAVNVSAVVFATGAGTELMFFRGFRENRALPLRPFVLSLRLQYC